MKRIFLSLYVLTFLVACEDKLDITNPNEPTPASATTRRGIIALAQGAVYINGFQESKFGGDYFSFVMGMHDRMGDIIGSDYNLHFLSCPDLITLDDGSVLESINIDGQKGYLRKVNVPTSQANVLFYEWALMYGMNGTLNQVLTIIDEVEMSDDQKNTIKAWAYFWKGFAYSRIGSLYYAGIINDASGTTNKRYFSKEDILNEAGENFQKAEDLLLSISNIDDYDDIINALIPSICKRGRGYAVGIAEWQRNINTLRARNLLVNTPTSSANAEFWQSILALTSSGIGSNDNTFTIRTDELGNLLGSFLAAETIDISNYKVSERLIQDFDPLDRRLLNNFDSAEMWAPTQGRGTALNTRYFLVDQGKGMTDVMTYCDRTIGEQELYIAGSYEENLLMNAEALIHLGQPDAAFALIDELREFQGAGLAPLNGAGITNEEAMSILRRERRIALAFRGLSFYDARRWGILENGRSGAVVIDFSGNVSTNAHVDYGYMDYWDVPVAESFFNPASLDSAPITNPN